MQIQGVQNNISPSFGIKISQNFIKAAHNHYNYNIQTNKKQYIWNFNNKVAEFEKIGFDDFTLDYEQKIVNGSRKHFLIAKNDSDPKKNSVILKQNTLVKIVNKFMNMNEKEFRNVIRMHKG